MSMPLLPIRQRVGPVQDKRHLGDVHEASCEGLPKGGRQGQLEALTHWSPSQLTDSTDEGTAGTTSSDGLKLTVKNTFIDVMSPEEVRVELHGGAQSCVARLSEPIASFGQSPIIPEALPESEDEDEAGEEPQHGQGGAVFAVVQRADPRYQVKNTFVDVGVPVSQVDSRATQSCMARYSAPTPVNLPAPPSYAAPATFQEAQTSPPPKKSPRAQAGRQVFLEAMRSDFDQESDRSSMPPPSHSPGRTRTPTLPSEFDETCSSPSLNEAGHRNSSDSGHRVVVKNTFIDLAEDTPLAAERFAMSCTARFSGPAQFPVFSPTAGRHPPDLFRLQEASSLAPSQGSQLHGVLGADGQPACQPCAWFYKDTGCLNGGGCRYCHLCPQGELKNRKKQKIQRLRAQDAAAAATSEGADDEGSPERQQLAALPALLAAAPLAAPGAQLPRHAVAPPPAPLAAPLATAFPPMQAAHPVPVAHAGLGAAIPAPRLSISALLS